MCHVGRTATLTRRDRLPSLEVVRLSQGLKGVDETVSRVFAGKKSQVIASSFFAFGASFQALTRGNAGVLGLFSAVTLLWSLLGAMADASGGVLSTVGPTRLPRPGVSYDEHRRPGKSGAREKEKGG